MNSGLDSGFLGILHCDKGRKRKKKTELTQ